MQTPVLLSCLLALTACDGGDPITAAGKKLSAPSLEAVTVQEPAAIDAAALYLTNCAMCHGEQGDGKGIVKLDRPARSFQDGGFSFGNTRTAIARTIGSGIGGTPMPGFAETLDEAQRLALADLVIAFGPEQKAPAPGATEMIVADRPLVARGMLPPIADGRPLLPRGLLLGGTDGLSWEYDAKPLRLLGVRQGAFVNRDDWGERGGAPLTPLGKLQYLVAVEEGSSAWAWTPAAAGGIPGPQIPGGGGAPEMPLQAQLAATEVSDGQAWVEYLLLDPSGNPVARVREHGEATAVGQWSGFQLLFEIEPIRAEGLLLRRPLEEVGLGEELDRFEKSGQDWLIRQRADGSAEAMAAAPAFVLADAAPGVLEETHLYGRPWTDDNRSDLLDSLR